MVCQQGLFFIDILNYVKDLESCAVSLIVHGHRRVVLGLVQDHVIGLCYSIRDVPAC